LLLGSATPRLLEKKAVQENGEWGAEQKKADREWASQHGEGGDDEGDSGSEEAEGKQEEAEGAVQEEEEGGEQMQQPERREGGRGAHQGPITTADK
jgi:hypothetical protein